MLFQVKSIANLRGYRDVPITWFATKRAEPLFGPNGTTGIPYHYLTDSHDDQDTDRPKRAEIAVEECFTYEEARSLSCWLHTHGHPSTRIAPAKLPWPCNDPAYSTMPVGDETDFIALVTDAAYTPQFCVMGYFDLRGCAKRFPIDPWTFTHGDDLTTLGRNIADNLNSAAMKGVNREPIVEDLHAWTDNKYADSGLMPVSEAVELAIGVWLHCDETRRNAGVGAEVDAERARTG